MQLINELYKWVDRQKVCAGDWITANHSTRKIGCWCELEPRNLEEVYCDDVRNDHEFMAYLKRKGPHAVVAWLFNISDYPNAKDPISRLKFLASTSYYRHSFSFMVSDGKRTDECQLRISNHKSNSKNQREYGKFDCVLSLIISDEKPTIRTSRGTDTIDIYFTLKEILDNKDNVKEFLMDVAEGNMTKSYSFFGYEITPRSVTDKEKQQSKLIRGFRVSELDRWRTNKETQYKYFNINGRMMKIFYHRFEDPITNKNVYVYWNVPNRVLYYREEVSKNNWVKHNIPMIFECVESDGMLISLNEALQIAPIPCKSLNGKCNNVGKLAISGAFSQSLLKEIGCDYVMNCNCTDGCTPDYDMVEQFMDYLCKKYPELHFEDVQTISTSDDCNCYRFDFNDEQREVVDHEMILNGRDALEKYLDECVTVDDENMISVYKEITTEEMAQEGFLFDFTKWNLYCLCEEDDDETDNNVVNTDVALFVQGSIAPCDVDWVRSCNHYFTCKNKSTYIPTIFCNGNVTIYNAYSKDKLFKFN